MGSNYNTQSRQSASASDRPSRSEKMSLNNEYTSASNTKNSNLKLNDIVILNVKSQKMNGMSDKLKDLVYK